MGSYVGQPAFECRSDNLMEAQLQNWKCIAFWYLNVKILFSIYFLDNIHSTITCGTAPPILALTTAEQTVWDKLGCQCSFLPIFPRYLNFLVMFTDHMRWGNRSNSRMFLDSSTMTFTHELYSSPTFHFGYKSYIPFNLLFLRPR